MCTVGLVPSVTITGTTLTTVIFTTDSKGTSATDSSPDYIKRTNGTYTVQRTQIQPRPDQQPGGPVPPRCIDPVTGNTGAIYLDFTGGYIGSSAIGSCYIRGAHLPLLSDETQIAMKWPDCGADDADHHELSMVAQRFTVSGYAGNAPADHSVELHDPAVALASQDIRWNGTGSITLALTKAGFAAFKAPYHESGKLEIWPTAIEIAGKPDGGFLSRIDLRDQTLAWPVQHLHWTDASKPITLVPTELGFNRFGIFTDKTKAAAKLVASATPEMHDAIHRLHTAHRAMGQWNKKGVRVDDNGDNHDIKSLMRRLNGES